MRPRVNLLVRPAIDWNAVHTFLDENETQWKRTKGASDSEEIIELAGRICYMSFGERQSPKSNSEYVQNLIDQGHESVFEHANWTFEISNITRAFSHQLVRHRIGFSYSQLSQQYADHSEVKMHPGIDFNKMPKSLKAWDDAEKLLREIFHNFKKAVKEDADNIEFGSDKEKNRFVNTIARQVLPNATTTSIVVSANARSLRHFLKTRGAIIGDPEMRAVCVSLYKILAQEAGAIFSDFQTVVTPDGTKAVKHVKG